MLSTGILCALAVYALLPQLAVGESCAKCKDDCERNERTKRDREMCIRDVCNVKKGPCYVAPTPKPEPCVWDQGIAQTRRGNVTVGSLVRGDEVLGWSEAEGGKVWSPFIAHVHKSDAAARFVKVLTKTGLEMYLSGNHFLFCSSCAVSWVQASELREGDSVRLPQGHEDQIEQLSEETKLGFSAPLTEAGNLFIDGLLVSSYAADNTVPLFAEHYIYHASFAPVRWINKAGLLNWFALGTVMDNYHKVYDSVLRPLIGIAADIVQAGKVF